MGEEQNTNGIIANTDQHQSINEHDISSSSSSVVSNQLQPSPEKSSAMENEAAAIANLVSGQLESSANDQQSAVERDTTPKPPNEVMHKNPSDSSPSQRIKESKIYAILSSQLKRKRLPHDKIGIFEDRIAINPMDTQAWLSLIKEHKEKGKVDEVRAAFQRFFKVYPGAANQWIDWINLEQQYNNFQKVEEIFAKCLPTVHSVPLYKVYLDYVRRVNSISSGGQGARDIITAAFDFVVKSVGLDRDSGSIWSEYLDFVKGWDVRQQIFDKADFEQAGTKWQEQQQMDQLRKIFQRAVCIPLDNLESLWRRYDAFENGLNRATARKFLAEKSPAYMTARASLRELSDILSKINRKDLPSLPTWDSSDVGELLAWKRWIEWEKSDPLVLESPKALSERVIYAYRQAIIRMRFYPEIWSSAAEYYVSRQMEKEASDLLKQGILANPTSYLLHFQYAEHVEANGCLTENQTIFENLIQAVTAEIEKVQATAEIQKSQIMEAVDENDEIQATIASEEEDDAKSTENQDKKESQIKAINEDTLRRCEAFGADLSVAWVMYMRAMRRTEGIKSTRLVFAKARKALFVSHIIYSASAMMEYHCSKDATIARKVFEFGLKKYSQNADYVLSYLDFLININDDANARALFERTVPKFEAESARPLYQRFYQYEAHFGDLGAVLKLDSRMTDLYPKESSLSKFRLRNRYGRSDAIANHDLGGLRLPAHPSEIKKSSDSSSDDSDSSTEDEKVETPKKRKRKNKRPIVKDRKPGNASPARKRLQTKTLARDSPSPTGAPVLVQLPDALATMVSRLPPAEIFDGATFHCDKLVDLILKAEVRPVVLGDEIWQKS
ncbi:mRNA 3'-end-processing protein RNA14 [Neolecta irregularis DAH-3]|uniref:mRNA 3'-end-processing protein RNA14 n=1 Tax=Neolecta irregularis (strain DAH-3) TaxID=1198029 RepID=A0A1U7LGD3_NEOID|nr:mRNA 3'-end-processing protein RNA14 [Neolecta irregularis DAH-3]|eukprot:OLL21715.1 mRNA 3'-end-processing protein RNA14 [Neolecta irregularis DAH-3]